MKNEYDEKKEKKHKRNLRKCLRIIKKNRQGIGFTGGVILLVLLVILIGTIWWSITLEQKVCTRCGDQGEILLLKGVLRGFSKNESINRYDVFLSNKTYHFSVFDSDYMRSFIGFDITIKTCYHVDPSGQIEFFEFMSCWINTDDN